MPTVRPPKSDGQVDGPVQTPCDRQSRARQVTHASHASVVPSRPPQRSAWLVLKADVTRRVANRIV